MITTLRLPAETEALVRRIAKRTGRSKSRVIRDALALLAEREAAEEGEERPYQVVAHLIGSVDSGGQRLSERTGQRFARLLADRRRGRRAR
jgi:hypothetical protein